MGGEHLRQTFLQPFDLAHDALPPVALLRFPLPHTLESPLDFFDESSDALTFIFEGVFEFLGGVLELGEGGKEGVELGLEGGGCGGEDGKGWREEVGEDVSLGFQRGQESREKEKSDERRHDRAARKGGWHERTLKSCDTAYMTPPEMTAMT
jgi:hypothetical protein